MKHVSSYMEAGHSLYLPNVVQPAQLQHDFVQQGYKVLHKDDNNMYL